EVAARGAEQTTVGIGQRRRLALASDGGEQQRDQCASAHVSPCPRSTTKGTKRSAAPLICALTIGPTSATSEGGASSTSSSGTWSSLRAWYFPRRAASTFSMARLTRSAAVPWMGVLTAVLSAALRAAGFLLLMSGR